ncbi:772_t:CDS:1 [Paraglomus brasilianum]|uniref:772_t:CDS:1 n=1 Tax=Paraglomus brasilianum TaxID=144538 RepID=A0A9N8WMF1_9GLOM|nr:772_t:CDS:1 [Paraglomus brasilianum]
MRPNNLVFESKYLLPESKYLLPEYKYLLPGYKYLLNEMDVTYLHDSMLDVTEHIVELRETTVKMAWIYYCGKLLTCFPIPSLSEAREMAKQHGWTKIVDDFTFFRCILDLYLAGVQRKHVAKIALNVWIRACDSARESFNISS